MAEDPSESARGGLLGATHLETMHSTEEVARWLSTIGMADYAPVFRAQGVTGRTLLSLNTAELRKTLGVAKLRDRRTILEQIKYLREAYSEDSRKVLPEDGRILTHLSNERIFLGWMRFAIIMQTAAIATMRLVNLVNNENNTEVRAMSGLLCALAIVAVLYGTARYYWMHRLVEQPGTDYLPGTPELFSPVMFICIGAVIALYALMARSTEEAAILALLSV